AAPRELDAGVTGTANWTWTSESYPADAVSLRSVSSDNFVVVDATGEPRVIGETDFTSGPSTLHPKAIYMVEGKLYPMDQLDFDGRKGLVREIDCDYYTDAISYSRVTVLDTFRTGTPGPASNPGEDETIPGSGLERRQAGGPADASSEDGWTSTAGEGGDAR